jgi:hypothetical protein
MSQITDQAEELRQRAIALLMQEQEAIDEKLSQLGHDGHRPASKRSCSTCGAADHNARRCPKGKALDPIGG